jgi:acetyl-CoA C-acetyltransferase/acetyl-CoA acyltransferase
MPSAVIIDAVRTPMGRGRSTGALAGVHPTDLLATTFTALVERSGLHPSLVDDVLIGCVSQVGDQASTPGRQAWLAAGYPVEVPSVTIERKCGSGQQAIEFAAMGIVTGLYDVAIAGGVESMSRVPFGSARLDRDPLGPAVHARFPDIVPQGISAEMVAAKWGLSREDVDAYSARSHARAQATAVRGGFDHELVGVTTPDGVVNADETIRPTTSMDGLAALGPAFDRPEFRDRFPWLNWLVTAGNSSQITDGASSLLLMSEERARDLGLRPRVRIVASAVVGDDPVMMLTGPIPATAAVLRRSGLRLDEIDAFEVNEAFASVPLAWQREYEVDDARLNPRGGAIALGHPLGASGARLMTTLINHLEQTGGRYGLQTMCEAGGMANATIIEREDT